MADAALACARSRRARIRHPPAADDAVAARDNEGGRDIPTIIGDARELSQVQAAVNASRPEVVFHLTAQALVNRPLVDPVGTYRVNVLGTANLLEAARRVKQARRSRRRLRHERQVLRQP